MPQFSMPQLNQTYIDTNTTWNETDIRRYHRLPYWMAKIQDKKMNRDAPIFGPLLGDIKWQPNSGDTGSAIMKTRAPYLRQSFNPNRLSALPRLTLTFRASARPSSTCTGTCTRRRRCVSMRPSPTSSIIPKTSLKLLPTNRLATPSCSIGTICSSSPPLCSFRTAVAPRRCPRLATKWSSPLVPSKVTAMMIGL